MKVTYGYVSAIFKTAVLDGVIAKSPCVGIKLPTVEEVPVVPLRTEVVQLLAEKICKPFRPMVVFCAATGLRSSELRGLTWDRVDTSMITIDRWHQLRHYHASQLIAGGMSPVAVAHRLGHKDATETLRTYAHLWPDDDTKAAAITDGGVTMDLDAFAHGMPMGSGKA